MKSSIPFRKLQKICCYGFSIISFLLVFTYLQSSKPIDRVKDDVEMPYTWKFENFPVSQKEEFITTLLQNLDQQQTSNHQPKPSLIIQTKPFKFYIYELPDKFNSDLIQCMKESKSYGSCFDLRNNGMGQTLKREDGYIVMDTNQFSLEVIIHNQLLHHPYRTLNMSEADVFYVPAYMGLPCFCFKMEERRYEIINDLYEYLSNQKPFQELKPHFSTIAKIEREQSCRSCPLLKMKQSRKITFLAIERETNKKSRINVGVKSFETIVAPYPSYVHYTKPKINTPGLHDRNVVVFFAASTRRSNYFRNCLIDQFKNKTKDQYEDFYRIPDNTNIKQVMLVTQECLGNHKFTTIPWMRRSVFCLEPPGDSPTRKSFYDAILSGCIPVLFHYNNGNRVRYPFDSVLNYTDFTVILPATHGKEIYPDVFQTLSEIPSTEIQRLYNNLAQVSQYFQYSFLSNNSQREPHPDAIMLILEEIRKLYKKNK
ncbi:hypothetical protein LOTGIDRAFT_239263 [Lottia gigantea]|uniref:Exostosin GT47 domain-containing protein n=1 Tax=Lottia gigantea TaxID=225164 RepID=V4ASC9_LOTGI|nr:hypothetical protein LOTGIDRAFT_239263 [Lottia gigantea]ESO96636.1 hypothetical protein LOTGIDRAFT_239263 [Lottia gigantea]